MQSVEFSLPLQSGKPGLPKGLVQDNRNRIGQIQGTDIESHGDPYAGVLVIHQDFFRNTGALLAEHDVVIRTEIRLAVETLSLGRGIPQTRRAADSSCRAGLQGRTVFFTACFFAFRSRKASICLFTLAFE